MDEPNRRWMEGMDGWKWSQQRLKCTRTPVSAFAAVSRGCLSTAELDGDGDGEGELIFCSNSFQVFPWPEKRMGTFYSIFCVCISLPSIFFVRLMPRCLFIVARHRRQHTGWCFSTFYFLFTMKPALLLLTCVCYNTMQSAFTLGTQTHKHTHTRSEYIVFGTFQAAGEFFWWVLRAKKSLAVNG